ncbi:MAG: transcriptional regulator [Thalassolituus sp.]|jgi:putative transcriptional regulator|nr:MAG: transcriptional regulator [Thalassolituus sp.]
MKDELFNDLLASANEMVAIEKGERAPKAEDTHSYNIIDVKAIREALGKSRDEFALIVGTSSETIKSWETKRRNPTGPAQKLLRLIQSNPLQVVSVLENDDDYIQEA